MLTLGLLTIRTALIPFGLLTIRMALIPTGLLIGLTGMMITITITHTLVQKWRLLWM